MWRVGKGRGELKHGEEGLEDVATDHQHSGHSPEFDLIKITLLHAWNTQNKMLFF